MREQQPQPGQRVDADGELVGGLLEREQPLPLPREVLQLDAEHVVACAGGTPPAGLGASTGATMRNLVGQQPPAVPVIPETPLAEWVATAPKHAAAAAARSLGD